MKKSMIIFLMVLLISNDIYSQRSVRDSLRYFTTNVINQAINKGKIKKIAVWDFTDMNKEVSNFGSYIAEQFSIYAESVDSVELMDRQNLKSLLNEHKLKSEGFIDKNTIMELGKFKEVEAVAVGSVIMADKDFQVVVKVIETSFGRTIAADEQFFPIDKKIAAILGIEFNENSNPSGNSNLNTANRGYNRPINSNEQYNNSSTVNKECEKNNTGDYCFYNGSKKVLKLVIEVQRPERPGEYRGYSPQEDILLKPGQSKCIYDIPAGSKAKFEAQWDSGNNRNQLIPMAEIYDQGSILIEKCKSKTYTIK